MYSTLGERTQQGQLPRSLGQDAGVALALTGREWQAAWEHKRIQSRVLRAMPQGGSPTVASASSGTHERCAFCGPRDVGAPPQLTLTVLSCESPRVEVPAEPAALAWEAGWSHRPLELPGQCHPLPGHWLAGPWQEGAGCAGASAWGF